MQGRSSEAWFSFSGRLAAAAERRRRLGATAQFSFAATAALRAQASVGGKYRGWLALSFLEFAAELIGSLRSNSRSHFRCLVPGTDWRADCAWLSRVFAFMLAASRQKRFVSEVKAVSCFWLRSAQATRQIFSWALVLTRSTLGSAFCGTHPGPCTTLQTASSAVPASLRYLLPSLCVSWSGCTAALQMSDCCSSDWPREM